MDRATVDYLRQVEVEVRTCRECAAMDQATFEYLAVALLKAAKERSGRGLGEDDINIMTTMSYHMSDHSKKKLEEAI